MRSCPGCFLLPEEQVVVKDKQWKVPGFIYVRGYSGSRAFSISTISQNLVVREIQPQMASCSVKLWNMKEISRRVRSGVSAYIFERLRAIYRSSLSHRALDIISNNCNVNCQYTWKRNFPTCSRNCRRQLLSTSISILRYLLQPSNFCHKHTKDIAGTFVLFEL